jgi:hypothetical protein
MRNKQESPCCNDAFGLDRSVACITSVVNMAAPLTICTKQGRCALVTFLWAEGVRGVEFHLRLSTQYCDDSAAAKCVRVIDVSKMGRTSVANERLGE